MQDEKKKDVHKGTRLLRFAAPKLTALSRVGAAVCLLGLPLGLASTADAQVIISEFRLSGPVGGSGQAAAANNARDEFVELYNTTGSPINITGYTLSYTLTGTSPTTPGAQGTTTLSGSIPAFGHFLLGGVSYSLNSSIPRDQFTTSPATPGSTPTTDIYYNSPLTLSNGSNVLDTVAVTGQPRPGFLPASLQFSYARRSFDTSGSFGLVAPTISTNIDTVTPELGGAGPQTTASQSTRNDLVVSLFDPLVSASAAPNRVRTQPATPGGGGAAQTNGTIRIRRTITNNSTEPIRNLRFRAVAITTANSPTTQAGTQADVRLLSSPTESGVTRTGGQPSVTAFGASLQSPSVTPPGGGRNSSVIALQQAIPVGGSVSYNFLLGVETPGNFSPRAGLGSVACTKYDDDDAFIVVAASSTVSSGGGNDD